MPTPSSHEDKPAENIDEGSSTSPLSADAADLPTRQLPTTTKPEDGVTSSDQPATPLTTNPQEETPSPDIEDQQTVGLATAQSQITPTPTEQTMRQRILTSPLVAGQVIKKKVRRKPLKILLSICAILLLLGGGSAGAAYYYFQNTIQKPLSHIIRPVARSTREQNIQPTATADVSSGEVQGKTWNILLLGSDNDQKYVFPNVLTQVMMVVRVDTIHNTVTMVSIPRDSWVAVPNDMGMHKIDQAFSLGVQQGGKFEDGVSLARQTVEADYGIHIDRYAWVGLDGFAKVIDTLHGVDINVEHPVVDDTYPNDVGAGSNTKDLNAYKRLYLAPGPQHLNGHEALEYVRSRHSDLVGDIGRTQRQQQVLEALKLKLNVSALLQNFSQLLNDVSGSLYTDFSEEEMFAFANYGRTLLNNPIDHITLGTGVDANNYGELATIYDPSAGSNQDVIIPHCDTIQPEINRIFQLGDAQSCRVNG